MPRTKEERVGGAGAAAERSGVAGGRGQGAERDDPLGRCPCEERGRPRSGALRNRWGGHTDQQHLPACVGVEAEAQAGPQSQSRRRSAKPRTHEGHYAPLLEIQGVTRVHFEEHFFVPSGAARAHQQERKG